MKIETSETVEKYENWVYEVDSLPDDFQDWDSDDQYDWLAKNCESARMLNSEYIDNCRVDYYEIVE